MVIVKGWRGIQGREYGRHAPTLLRLWSTQRPKSPPSETIPLSLKEEARHVDRVWWFAPVVRWDSPS